MVVEDEGGAEGEEEGEELEGAEGEFEGEGMPVSTSLCIYCSFHESIHVLFAGWPLSWKSGKMKNC